MNLSDKGTCLQPHSVPD